MPVGCSEQCSSRSFRMGTHQRLVSDLHSVTQYRIYDYRPIRCPIDCSVCRRSHTRSVLALHARHHNHFRLDVRVCSRDDFFVLHPRLSRRERCASRVYSIRFGILPIVRVGDIWLCFRERRIIVPCELVFARKKAKRARLTFRHVYYHSICCHFYFTIPYSTHGTTCTRPLCVDIPPHIVSDCQGSQR